MNEMTASNRSARRLAAAALAAGVASLPCEAAAAGPGEAAASLLGLLALVVLLSALGLAVGAFGMIVNHIFRRRASLTFRLLCARPGRSLLAGVAVTLLGLGLLAVLHAVRSLQLVVLVAFMLGLALLAIAVAVRFAGRVIDPTTLDDELPEARLLLKGGLLLAAVNAVPIVGTVLFAGILFAALGATLLGYFARQTS